MQSKYPASITLQTMHEVLAVLADVFCEQVCKECQWSPSTFHFHLHHPGHLKKKERQKINEAMRNLLADTLVQVPQIKDRSGT